METIVVHDIERLVGLDKSGLLDTKRSFSIQVVDACYVSSSPIVQLQFQRHIDNELIHVIDSDCFQYSVIQSLYKKYGFGLKAYELMSIAYCKQHNFALLTDDISLSRVSYKESVMTYNYDQITEYVLNVNIDNEIIMEIKKSGRRPT